MTNTEIIVNLATMIAEQRLEITELKTEVAHLHHELLATMSEADTPQTEKTCDNCGTPRDKCVYCIEEDRMWTPQTDLLEDDKCFDCEDFFVCDEHQTDCGWK